MMAIPLASMLCRTLHARHIKTFRIAIVSADMTKDSSCKLHTTHWLIHHSIPLSGIVLAVGWRHTITHPHSYKSSVRYAMYLDNVVLSEAAATLRRRSARTTTEGTWLGAAVY